MKQINNYGDERQLAWCVYCGGSAKGTRDHVPSKVLIDRPYPENLPVVEACKECNSSFSRDEEYLACLVECTIAGSTEPGHIQRGNVRDILTKRPRLRDRLSEACIQTSEETIFQPEMARVHNVVLKLARGHAAYELNEPQFEEPEAIAVVPLPSLSAQAREDFEAGPGGDFAPWPEVGSRAMQRLVEGHDMGNGGWITVQDGRYRFLAAIADGVVVRMVLSEYVACEVVWSL